MKNYDEVTNDLLERRDRYVAEQKRKRKRMIETVTPLCCVCLVALLGLGIWQGGWFNSPLDQRIDDALYPGEKDYFDESKGESADNPAVNNKIIVHQVSGIFGDRQNIALMCSDFVKMTRDEMKEYYGVDYIPDVPSDITAWDDKQSGIYKRGGGTGEIYWDTDILNYSNEDFTRTVHLEVAKDGFPLIDYYLYFNSTEEKSVINNVEVMIGQTDSGYYYAEFMYHDVGFMVNAQGVSLDEFVAIIASIVD